MTCAISVEDTWGPVVSTSCLQGFDFTLLFEESVLTILPLGLIALWSCVRGYRLLRSPAKVLVSWLLIAKLATYLAYVALQCALLGLWTPYETPKTRATLATIIFTIVVFAFLTLLSLLEHTRAIRPSTALTVYLGVSTLLDIARARTLFYIPGLYSIPSIFLTAFCIKVLVFLLELFEKRRLIRPQWREASKESTGSVYNRSLFIWLNSLFVQGFRKLLTVDVLPPVDSHILAASKPAQLSERWENAAQHKKHALFGVFLVHFKWDILAGVLPRLCYTGFNFAQPFLIARTLNLVRDQDTANAKNIGYGLIGAYAIVYIGIAISHAVYEHKTYRTLTLFRGSLISLIYRKTLQASTSAIADAEAITLMSSDIDRISQSMRFMHEWYASLLELGLSLWLLYIYLGVAMAASAAFIILVVIVSAPIATAAGNAQNPWLEAIEERLASTVQALGSVKAIKATGLTQHVHSVITALRIAEIAKSRRYRILDALLNAGFYISSQLAPVWGFGVYILLARARDTETLTESIAFAALSVFTLQYQPTIDIVDGIEQIQTMTNCFERIQEYIGMEGRVDSRNGCGRPSRPDSGMEKGRSTPHDSSMTATLADVCVWYGDDTEPVLNAVSLQIQAKATTAIVGPVGCGKSTLLKVLLGETGRSSGEAYTNFSTAAYCPQSPWITWGSIRDNIVGMSGWDESWYLEVVRACQLSKDFEDLPHGDQTATGTRGSRLSGGQQIRISLARALYSREPILILDDVLTGLDRTTERGILDAVFGADGLLKRLNATVVMATNSVHHCQFADQVIVLDKNGKVSERGSFQSLSSAGGYISRVSGAPSVMTARPQLALADETLEALQLPEGDDGVENDESRRSGDLRVYGYYAKIAGWWNMLTFWLLCAAFMFGMTFSSLWLQLWTNANARHPNDNIGYWLGIYGLIAAIAIIGGLSSDLLFKLVIVPKTSKKFHDILLDTTMDAPTAFLTSADSGTITNRFSQDLQLIDNDLPTALDQTVFYILSSLGAAVLVFIGSGYVAVAIPGCILILYLIQNYYLRTSRQLRLLDIEAKAPLFSQFLETLSGLACIRAYGWTENYLERNTELLNHSQKPYYLLWCIQRWLTLVLDLFVAGVAVLLVAISTNSGHSEFLGTSLFNVVNFSMTLQFLVAEWTQLETAIGAVSRIRSFVSRTQNEALPGEIGKLPDNWPDKGDITFNKMSVSYSSANEVVLKDIDFSIPAGKKVAICGRTGSGKSSLSLSVLRMVEIYQGSIVIDGVDIGTVSRGEVRKRLNAIPQEPFFLPGSLRDNIDPLKCAQDERIISILTRLGLWNASFRNNAGGLDQSLDLDTLSHGQRQLLCFARAVIRPGRIVIMDEVTASMDAETESLVQRVIREEFGNCTVLAIAHRLDTVLDFDQVVVLDNGHVVETGVPSELLGRQGSRFKSMYEVHYDSVL